MALKARAALIFANQPPKNTAIGASATKCRAVKNPAWSKVRTRATEVNMRAKGLFRR